MGFVKLVHAEFGEKRADAPSLQPLFNRWGDVADQRAGAPRWLEDMEVWGRQKTLTDPLGYSFEPDVLSVSAGKQMAIELKYAPKYEPMALAEILHHVARLPLVQSQVPWDAWTQAEGPPLPVLVTRFNWWIRVAIAWLHEQMKPDGVRLRHVEVEALSEDRAHAPVMLWFHDADARWRSDDERCLPRELRELVGPTSPSVTVRDDADVAAITAAPGPFDPNTHGGHQVWCARIGRRERWLVWNGTWSTLGTYWLLDPELPDEDTPKLILT